MEILFRKAMTWKCLQPQAEVLYFRLLAEQASSSSEPLGLLAAELFHVLGEREDLSSEPGWEPSHVGGGGSFQNIFMLIGRTIKMH
jgi:hypothetical protein